MNSYKIKKSETPCVHSAENGTQNPLLGVQARSYRNNLQCLQNQSIGIKRDCKPTPENLQASSLTPVSKQLRALQSETSKWAHGKMNLFDRFTSWTMWTPAETGLKTNSTAESVPSAHSAKASCTPAQSSALKKRQYKQGLILFVTSTSCSDFEIHASKNHMFICPSVWRKNFSARPLRQHGKRWQSSVLCKQPQHDAHQRVFSGADAQQKHTGETSWKAGARRWPMASFCGSFILRPLECGIEIVGLSILLWDAP